VPPPPPPSGGAVGGAARVGAISWGAFKLAKNLHPGAKHASLLSRTVYESGRIRCEVARPSLNGLLWGVYRDLVLG
jgi:hypothetical protein